MTLNTPKIRIIGDIHYNISEYLKLIKNCESTIQLGDLGFNYKFLDFYKIDPTNHKFFGGNHDNYNILLNNNIPHNLGDYGPIPSLPNSFFVRGAWSIDGKFRRSGIDWWPEEELSHSKFEDLLLAYEVAKPEIMLSHQVCDKIAPLMGLDEGFAFRMGHTKAFPLTRTGQVLEKCFEIHKPRLWIFGHYHKDFDQVIDGTRFVCLTADPSLNCKQKFLDLIL